MMSMGQHFIKMCQMQFLWHSKDKNQRQVKSNLCRYYIQFCVCVENTKRKSFDNDKRYQKIFAEIIFHQIIVCMNPTVRITYILLPFTIIITSRPLVICQFLSSLIFSSLLFTFLLRLSFFLSSTSSRKSAAPFFTVSLQVHNHCQITSDV